jgi:type I restriction-modification system DNA methylase subunit
MDFKQLSYDELIDYCKTNQINYQTKAKKNKSHKILLKELLEKSNSIDSSNEPSNELEMIIKKCHNYLYKSSAIVGSKAQNDIMRVLIIRIINLLVKNKNPFILDLINEFKKNNLYLNDFKDKYDSNFDNIQRPILKARIQMQLNFLDYLEDITSILKYKGIDILDLWKEFITDCISIIFNNIYDKNDYIFNTPNGNDIIELIEIISEIKIDGSFIDNFAQMNGDIHEYFLKYQGNVNSKELGQFFTPRNVIEKIICQCGFKELINENPNNNLSLFDPCMGTGGMLCYTYNNCKDKIDSNAIYGCDVEKDTIKMGIASLIITTDKYNTNIIRCNSLTDNPYLFDGKKFDVIFTNPPFGTKNNYKDIQKLFKNKDKADLFKEVYPIDTNKGTNLFIQLVIYLLNEGGICSIILPDGELMTGKSCYEIRKLILDKCRLHKIISIESGAFMNTGIKTKALIFQKGNYDNYNQEVEFLEITNNEVVLLGKEKLNENLHFNLKKKEEEVIYNSEIEIKTLGEVCEICPKSKRLASYGSSIGNYPFITSSQQITKYCDTVDYANDDYIIIGTGGNPNIHFQNNFSCSADCYVLKGSKYIYYYLKYNLDILAKGFTGSTIKHISKDYITNIKIPIPSLEKQEEIVNYLDLLNSNIGILKKEIELNKKLAEEFMKSSLI